MSNVEDSRAAKGCFFFLSFQVKPLNPWRDLETQRSSFPQRCFSRF